MYYILCAIICATLGFCAAMMLTDQLIRRLHKRIELLENLISMPYDYARYDEIINEQLQNPTFHDIYCSNIDAINAKQRMMPKICAARH